MILRQIEFNRKIYSNIQPLLVQDRDKATNYSVSRIKDFQESSIHRLQYHDSIPSPTAGRYVRTKLSLAAKTLYSTQNLEQ